MKKELQKIFHDPKAKLFHIVNDFFALVTIVAVVTISMETVKSFEPYQNTFLIIEYVVVFLFLLEYIARIIAAQKPLSYIWSFFGLIDLLSILPTLLGIVNLSFLKGVRFIRLMRVFRVLRLVRFAYDHLQNSTNTTIDENDIHSKSFWLKVEIYILIFFIAALLSASGIYLAEGERAEFASIPMAILWSAKILLGGAHSAGVQTVFGEIIIISTRFVGLILFGLLINIIGGALRKLLFGKKRKN